MGKRKPTLQLLRRLNLLPHFERLAGVHDVDDSARSGGFEILEECTGVAPVGVGGVDTLCGEVVEFLEVGVPVRV